ncbi:MULTISPECIES: hypothetical protein [unclassified Streptomyces]|uniref:hypothetical protein n=1 Tax=unclassified Streptomyces TaxID=2593676 RepID=UPI002E1D29A5|nr:hypothetical protein OG217_03435 [Streptomyces sp. NBC_01023]
MTGEVPGTLSHPALRVLACEDAQATRPRAHSLHEVNEMTRCLMADLSFPDAPPSSAQDSVYRRGVSASPCAPVREHGVGGGVQMLG